MVVCVSPIITPYDLIFNKSFADMGNQKYVPESCCVYSTNMGQYLNVINCQSPQFGPPRTADLTAARNDALHYKVS